MKTFPIAIVACGLLAAYISYPAQHKSRTTASTQTTLQQTKPSRPLGVFVPDENGNMVAMKIQKLTTQVTITGTLAVTTMDMTVFNPHNRVLEGEFESPVIEGQTVCRFALDINGRLREGVVVEKEKARAAFESVVRQKIDPALLEWTRGNTFKTRIYPIPARGTRRIVIAFEQELTSSSEGYAYALPFAFQEAIDTFDFHADVAAFGSRPSLAGNDLEGVAFTHRGRIYSADIHKTNIVVNKPFRCAIPVTAGNIYTSVNTFGPEHYFAAFIPVNSVTAERPAPRTITLLWDVSLSAQSRDINKELDLLDAFLKNVGNTRVTLIPFSIEPHGKQEFSIVGGSTSALQSAILALKNDGATQLGKLPLASLTTDLTLLVSDGISTFGNHQPQRAARPLHAITVSTQSDHDVLRAIAEQSGGAFVNLAETSVTDALPMLTSQRLSLTRIDVVSGVVTDTYPVGAVKGGMVTVGGIIDSPEAELTLHFGSSGTTSETIKLHVDARTHRDTGTAVARLWAQNRLRQLGMDRIRNEAAIVDLGKKFTIVTPGTSLLVLDRIEDYVRHRIEPPASEPELREQYFAMFKTQLEDSAAAVKQRIDYASNLVARRATWYDLTRKQLKKKATKDGDGLALQRMIGRVSSNDGVVARSNRSEEAVIAVGGSEGTVVADTFSGGLGVRDRDARSIQESVVSKQEIGSRFSHSAHGYATTVQQGEMNTSDVESDASAPAAPAQPSLSYDARFSDWEKSKDDDVSTEMEDAQIGSDMAISPVYDARWRLDETVRGYHEELTSTNAQQLYNHYLEIRETYGNVPGFYIDVSDIMRDKGLKAEALRVLSNMAEVASEDPRLLRVLGQRLMQLGESEYAVMVFDDVRRMRGEEPQSYRDLALAYAQAKQYQKAVDNLYQIITRTWDSRFPEIELIAVNELNRVLRDAGNSVNTSNIDARLIKPMPVDMRVVLSWDADNCDMDLWVIDPKGEKCYYSNRDTELGGHLSCDLTGGYGPEEFLLKTAPKGKYEFKVHYYGDSQQRLAGPTTITVDIFTKYGTEAETKKSMTVRVDGVERVVDIGSIAVN